MEAIGMLAITGFIFVLGIVLVLASGHATRNFDRGRSAIMIAAFFAPFLFTGYLLFAGYLRNQFHYDRHEASNFDGECTLSLSNGYKLTFFDELPSGSSIGKGDWRRRGVTVLTNIQKVSLTDHIVYGQTGTSDLPNNSSGLFFALDTSSGDLKKFPDEAALRTYAPEAPLLRETDEAFRLAENRERSLLFWPVIVALPFALLGSSLYLIRKAQQKKPVLEISNTGFDL